jgi:hypothetical protein
MTGPELGTRPMPLFPQLGAGRIDGVALGITATREQSVDMVSRDSRERGVPSGHRYTTPVWCTVSSLSVGPRNLSAGYPPSISEPLAETSACWSSVSGLTSTNELVPQSLPSEQRKVAGSIPALATKVRAA